MTHNGYVSPDEIAADVHGAVGDPKGDRFSEGFMLSQIQQALTELAYNTYFDERTAIIPINGCQTLDLPNGMFCIDKIFTFNGNECGGTNQNVVWWAKDWTLEGKVGFKEQQGENPANPIIEDQTFATTMGRVLYYNTLHGKLMLSTACLAFDNIFLKYRGLGVDFGSSPCIPHYLRQAVKDWVTIQCLTHKQWDAKDATVTMALREANASYYGNGGNRPGTKLEAKRRVMALDIKAQNDISKYLSELSLNIF